MVPMCSVCIKFAYSGTWCLTNFHLKRQNKRSIYEAGALNVQTYQKMLAKFHEGELSMGLYARVD